MENPSVEDEAAFAIENQSNWVTSIAAYFRDFLDTDFKRARLPKRKIQFKDGNGITIGIPLSRYPKFAGVLWSTLSEPLDQKMVKQIVVPRNKYPTASIRANE
jgi:hypothetical protein